MKNEPWWSDVSKDELIAGIKKLEEENRRLNRSDQEWQRYLMEGGTERVKAENELLRHLVERLAHTIDELPDVPAAIRESLLSDKDIQSVRYHRAVEVLMLHWLAAKSLAFKVQIVQGLKEKAMDRPTLIRSLEEFITTLKEDPE